MAAVTTTTTAATASANTRAKAVTSTVSNRQTSLQYGYVRTPGAAV